MLKNVIIIIIVFSFLLTLSETNKINYFEMFIMLQKSKVLIILYLKLH